MTIRDLTYRLFLFRGGESLTVTLRKYCCGDERRTCVLRKRLITQLSCVYPCAFAATDCLRHFVRLIPPRHVFIDSSQTSKYDTLFPLFSLVQPWMTGEFLNSITLLFCFSVTSASKTVCKYMLLSLAAISCMKYCQVTRWVEFSAVNFCYISIELSKYTQVESMHGDRDFRPIQLYFISVYSS